jgi:hypothetical protein
LCKSINPKLLVSKATTQAISMPRWSKYRAIVCCFQAQEAFKSFREERKPLTVALCHSALLSLPDDSPPGCKERFEETRRGEERWQNLADFLDMQLPASEYQDKLQGWQSCAQALIPGNPPSGH